MTMSTGQLEQRRRARALLLACATAAAVPLLSKTASAQDAAPSIGFGPDQLKTVVGLGNVFRIELLAQDGSSTTPQIIGQGRAFGGISAPSVFVHATNQISVVAEGIGNSLLYFESDDLGHTFSESHIPTINGAHSAPAMSFDGYAQMAHVVTQGAGNTLYDYTSTGSGWTGSQLGTGASSSRDRTTPSPISGAATSTSKRYPRPTGRQAPSRTASPSPNRRSSST
jgi:hypothetical protein